jgi:metal-sulfur cluster biosynthetic enzyme
MEPRRPPITRKEFIPKQFKGFSSSLQTKDPELYADIVENLRLIREMNDQGKREMFSIPLLPDDNATMLRAQIRKLADYYGVKVLFSKHSNELNVVIATDEEWKNRMKLGGGRAKIVITGTEDSENTEGEELDFACDYQSCNKAFDSQRALDQHKGMAHH